MRHIDWALGTTLVVERATGFRWGCWPRFFLAFSLRFSNLLFDMLGQPSLFTVVHGRDRNAGVGM